MEPKRNDVAPLNGAKTGELGAVADRRQEAGGEEALGTAEAGPAEEADPLRSPSDRGEQGHIDRRAPGAP